MIPFKRRLLWVETNGSPHSLLWLSFLAGGLLVARIAYSREVTHAYLLWNLFLAWLPLLFATLAWRGRRLPARAVSGVLWLLFLPNAPYLITDLIHLAPSARAPLWYDAVLLFTSALGGLLLGLRSLHMIHLLVRRRLGAAPGWLFVVVVSALTGLGVYIGRFLRWNSWDAFLHPLSLSADLMHSLSNPDLRLRMLVFVLLFAALNIFSYLFLFGAVARSSERDARYLVRAMRWAGFNR